MPGPLRLAALLLVALVLGALASGCKDDKKKTSDERPTATALAAAPTATEEPADEPTPADGPAGASPFESYHYTVDLEFSVEGETGAISGTVDGDFVAPDSHAFSTTFDIAGLSGTEEAVIIGEQAWYRESGEEWRETTRDDPDVVSAIDLTSADPGFLSAGDLGEDLSGLDGENEERNGVSTVRYHVPREAVETLTQLLGDEFLQDASGLESFEMTVWLEEESGGLVRAEFSATATQDIFGLAEDPDATVVISMVIDLTLINDSSISIEPPI